VFSGNFNFALGIFFLYLIVVLVRQFLEPRIVSSKIGIHPIFTLISMYAGFKIVGLLGLITGPIVLIVYKNAFESSMEGGIIKTLFEKE